MCVAHDVGAFSLLNEIDFSIVNIKNKKAGTGIVVVPRRATARRAVRRKPARSRDIDRVSPENKNICAPSLFLAVSTPNLLVW